MDLAQDWSWTMIGRIFFNAAEFQDQELMNLRKKSTLILEESWAKISEILSTWVKPQAQEDMLKRTSSKRRRHRGQCLNQQETILMVKDSTLDQDSMTTHSAIRKLLTRHQPMASQATHRSLNMSSITFLAQELTRDHFLSQEGRSKSHKSSEIWKAWKSQAQGY